MHCVSKSWAFLDWIYITGNFFKTFSPLSMCVLKIFNILKKKKKKTPTISVVCKKCYKIVCNFSIFQFEE